MTPPRIPKAKITAMHKHLDSALAIWQESVRPWHLAKGGEEWERDTMNTYLHTVEHWTKAWRHEVEKP